MRRPPPVPLKIEGGRKAESPQIPRRAFAMCIMAMGSIVISFGGLIVRNIEEASNWQINLYRALSTSIVVFIILLFQYRGKIFTKIHTIGRPGLAGGCLVATAGITFIQSLTTTTVANTLFILSAIPILTAGLAWIFLKERLERITVITMIVAVAGISIMVAEGFGIGSSYGNVMALITAVCFAGFAVIVRSYRNIDMLPTLLVSGAIMASVALVMSIDNLQISQHDFLLCILWGGVLSGMTNWTFIVASRHLVAAEVTLFMLLEFSLGPIWVWLFANETPTGWTLAGGVLVISAVSLRAALELGRSFEKLRRGRLLSPP